MKQEIKYLISLFFIVFGIKLLLSYFIPSISAFSDEYYYAKMARGFFFNQEFNIHGIKAMVYPPLYPIVLSISYIFNDMQIVYFFMKGINALISTTVIIPIYLLGKEFMTTKKSILLALLVAVIPSTFSFTQYLMAENLLYPVSITAIYFIYMAFTHYRTKYFIFAGMFIAFAFLIKLISIALVALPILFFIAIALIQKSFLKELFKKTVLLYAVAVSIILPFILSFGSFFNNSAINGINAFHRRENYAISLVNWIVLHWGYIILATGIIFGIFAIVGIIKNYRSNSNEGRLHLLVLITASLYVFIASNHTAGGVLYNTPFSFFTGRLNGRYIDVVLPLIFLIGFINFNKYYDKINKYIIGTSISMLFIAQLAITPLFPVNNLSLTHIGIFKYIVEFLLFNKTDFDVVFSWTSFIIIGIALALWCLSFIYLKKINFTKLATIMIIFFTVLSVSVYAINYYNTKTYWFNGDQMQMGYFFNSMEKDHKLTVMIDERDCNGKISRLDQKTLCENKISSIVGFFINENIVVGDPEKEDDYDYVITRHELDMDIVKAKNGLYLYKNK